LGKQNFKQLTMSNKTIEAITAAQKKKWQKEMDKHRLSMRYVAEHCFSNFRTIHNALVLGLASKKTQAMLDNFFSSLNTKK